MYGVIFVSIVYVQVAIGIYSKEDHDKLPPPPPHPLQKLFLKISKSATYYRISSKLNYIQVKFGVNRFINFENMIYISG